ncbi:hypothetical protein HYZ06_00580 [Candidatus Daviesbacteria bacterium]|nr:hypothetical protein [Candidatus Daviesbacteria bacterium]
MKTEFGEQGRSSWKPIGDLNETLGRFDAPDGVRRIIARRVGNLAGTRDLPISDITDVIEKSMSTHGGMPNWQGVTDSLANMANETYRRFRRY